MSRHHIRWCIPATITQFVLAAHTLFALEPDSTSAVPPLVSVLRNTTISGEWFFAYARRERESETTEAFLLKRGYLTVEQSLLPSLQVRVTQDIAVDQEGDGEGDIEIRLKYGYLQYTLDRLGFISQPFVELGVVHRPWIAFEESVNRYRLQGTMFLERVDIVRSADYGVTLGGLFGGKMDEEYMTQVNGAYPGRYGSFLVGMYNGGGYEAMEKNRSKLIEGRLTLRPIPAIIPGLQLSGIGGYGRGNTAEAPELRFAAGCLSMQHQAGVFTAQIYKGTGDVTGSAVDTSGNALRQDGFSLFLEIRSPWDGLNAFGRYDGFDRAMGTTTYAEQRSIAGLSYFFFGRSMVALVYEHVILKGTPTPPVSSIEVDLEFVF